MAYCSEYNLEWNISLDFVKSTEHNENFNKIQSYVNIPIIFTYA